MISVNSLPRCFGWFILIMILGFPLYGQYSVTSPLSITDGDSSFGNKSPRLSLNNDGDIMVFWSRAGTEAFYLSTKTAEGFTIPSQIPFGGLNPNLWSGSLGPNFASFNDHVYVTFEVYGDAIYVIHSNDGGETWDAPYPAFVPPTGRRATIPTIAVDNQGQPYIAYVNTNAAEEDAYYAMVRSEDFGSSFLDEVDVSSASFGDEVCECCNGHIEVAANGDIYIAFRNNASNLRDVWLVRSIDGGMTFQDAFDIDATDWNASVCPSNGPHFSIQGDEIVTTFYSGTGTSGSGVYFSSFNAVNSQIGETIDLPNSSEDSFNQNRPRIAGKGDTLAIVCQEYINGSTDIAMSVSTTGTAGLANDPFIIASLPSVQQLADVIYDGNDFHIVYEDNISGTVLYQSLSFNPVGINVIPTEVIKVSPNPCTNSFQVITEALTSYEMSLIDMHGRKVRSQILNSNSNEIFVDDLTPGMYLLTLGTDAGFYSEIIVIN